MAHDVKFSEVKTYADIVAYDPFPRTDARCSFDNIERADIIRHIEETYGEGLLFVVLYDEALVLVNGVKYTSEPLNKQTFVRQEKKHVFLRSEAEVQAAKTKDHK